CSGLFYVCNLWLKAVLGPKPLTRVDDMPMREYVISRRLNNLNECETDRHYIANVFASII
ncbi:hypothetical protein, partial [Shewanella sp. CG_4_10_14_3_um_filter_42_91]